MKLAGIRIGDLVELAPVRTVIRLEDGRVRAREITAGFVFTGEVAAHLDALTAALSRTTGQGCFLQGDFGSGKSHFLAALAAWADRAPGSDGMTARHEGLARLEHSGKRFLPVPVSLVNYRASTPLEQIVIGEVEQALARHGARIHLSPLTGFVAHLGEICRDPKLCAEFAKHIGVTPGDLPDWLEAHPRQAWTAGVPFLRKLGLPEPGIALLEDRHETFRRVLEAIRNAGFDGLILLVDELSEFFRAKPAARRLNEDARTLQFLGELAGTHPLWIVAAVQESIERTGDIAQATFRKIKDRFPVRFTLSTLHIRDLISRRLVKHKPDADRSIRKIHAYFREQFPSFSVDFARFRDIYPMHPRTLDLLEGLGDLFSEHRGIVDFVHAQIAGDPERNIPGVLDRPCTVLLAPDSIYDHFEHRLMQFSDFNAFPRHVVPHLDRVAAERLEDPEDVALARRLVRILVLYRIHPTAPAPTVQALVEMVSCVLEPGQPELNAEFVAEAVLAPIAANSRFLVKKSGHGGPAAEAVYEVAAQADVGHTLEARIQRMADEIDPGDSRPLTTAFQELRPGLSWPGPELVRPSCGATRTVSWRSSQRKVLTLFCPRGAEPEVRRRIENATAADEVELALVLTLWNTSFEPTDPAVAMWKIPPPEDTDGLLRRWFAARQLREELNPANPADRPLISPLGELLQRLAPAAREAALQAAYAGDFRRPHLHVEDAVRTVRRFDRLVEIAAAAILEERHPKFASVAPRGLVPSVRLYENLLEQFVMPGSISLQQARRRGLTGLIEGLAAPLGLVEVRSGAYVAAADPVGHPLPAFLHALLRPAGPTPLAEVMHALRTGPFGLPRETADFLLAALACAGTLTLLRGSRAVPLDFIRLTAIESVDAVTPGEIIGPADRDVLLRECTFLLPATTETDAAAPFGLKQQRETWQALQRFKKQAGELTEEVDRQLDRIAEFSAFAEFDIREIRAQLEAVRSLADEIKVSYSAREGLGRFIRAWKTARLAPSVLPYLKQLRRFLVDRADAFVFVHHYLHHPAVEFAAGQEPELTQRRATALNLLRDPDRVVADDDSRQLNAVFEHFREEYARVYADAHKQFYARRAPPRLSAPGRRALEVLRRLARIPQLAPPPGLDRLFEQLDRPAGQVCRRNLAEALLRGPVCDCGFRIGAEPADEPERVDPEATIQTALEEYLAALRSPQTLEALEARAYALREAEPEAAQHLDLLLAELHAQHGGAPARLVALLDRGTAEQVARALDGSVPVQRRRLGDLAEELGGRRLRPAQLRAAIEKWLGNLDDEDGLIVLDPAGAETGDGANWSWWPLLWRHALPRLVPAPTRLPDPIAAAAALETDFPAAALAPHFEDCAPEKLVRFIRLEPLHTQAVRAAWLVLARRVLEGRAPATAISGTKAGHLDPKTAAAVERRLTVLRQLADRLDAAHPARLAARIAAADVWRDSWATDPLKKQTQQCIEGLARDATDWLAALPALESVDLDRPWTVIVMDGVPPDVWIQTRRALPETFFARAETRWRRLDAAPETVEAMTRLLGLSADPVDALAARDVPYTHVSGREAHGLAEMLPEPPSGRAAVVRVALFDQGAHRRTLALEEMPGLLEEFCIREIAPVLAAHREQGRGLLLTTDHGLSFRAGDLAHGAGGVFETALFQAVWEAPQPRSRTPAL
ncbi:MAG: hypothetical protein GXP31_08515 [Kiritimatiellaeota bacterium]|nr:hypothetical protein [Kiritimatiellota bacterium]